MVDERGSGRSSGIKLGILPWSQAASWPEVEAFAVDADRLGYDQVWVWDHLYAIFGDPYQPIFEGWATLAAWAKVTERTRLGLLVGANTFRNPALVAKVAATLDHISGGRAILGIGGAWFELEHVAHGIDFGSSAGRRLDWLDEAVGVMRRILDGEEVTHRGDHYQFEQLRHQPLPLQSRLPIMIGGTGERKTLRTVAKYADIWNGMGTLETLSHKVDVLRRHCEEVGRDPSEIEMTVGCKPVIRDDPSEARRVWEAQMEHNRTPMSHVEDDVTFLVGTAESVAEQLIAYRGLGFATAIAEVPAPYDAETMERLAGEVREMVDAG